MNFTYISRHIYSTMLEFHEIENIVSLSIYKSTNFKTSIKSSTRKKSPFINILCSHLYVNVIILNINQADNINYCNPRAITPLKIQSTNTMSIVSGIFPRIVSCITTFSDLSTALSSHRSVLQTALLYVYLMLKLPSSFYRSFMRVSDTVRARL